MKNKISVDLDRNEIFVKEKRVHLPNKEYSVFEALWVSKKTMSRDQLAAVIWDGKKSFDVRTVDQHVARIRAKLGSDCIETVPCRGYRIAR